MAKKKSKEKPVEEEPEKEEPKKEEPKKEEPKKEEPKKEEPKKEEPKKEEPVKEKPVEKVVEEVKPKPPAWKLCNRCKTEMVELGKDRFETVLECPKCKARKSKC